MARLLGGTGGEPMTPDEARGLAAQLADAGLPTFPVGLRWNFDKGSIDKTPLSSPSAKNGFKDASADRVRVEEMFLRARLGAGQHWGAGVYPGPAGYIVLDVDTKNSGTGIADLDRLSQELGPLPTSMTVTTASGGRHIWLKRPVQPEHIGNVHIADGIEIRCDSGYVVAPGTDSPWGSWTRDPGSPRLVDVEPLPEAWARKLNGRQLDGNREPIPERITAGSRHAALLRLAGAMRRQGAAEFEILAALKAMNESRCDPPKADGEIEALAADVAGRYEPEPDPDLSWISPEPAADFGSLKFLSLADLCAKVDAAGPRKYLIRGIWPDGAYGVHAAEMKAQKSWNTVDLAVSVASGTHWLDTHPIDDPGPVLMFAGEGGEASIVRRIRAVCKSRGLQPEAMPITICLRAPHLGRDEHMKLFEDQVNAIQPKLVTLDPLYLAAAGAKGSDLYGMGELLETGQLICDTVNASLFVVTHFNRGNRTGAGRITGAGPAEWGRVLIGADIKSRHTDPDTKATTVVSVIDVLGGEVPDHEFRLKRTIVADDPADLDSPLHYSVEVTQEDGAGDTDDMPPARRKLLEAVAAVGAEGATGTQLVDWIADKYGHGLTRPTVSEQLNAAHKDGLVDNVVTPGGPTLWFPPLQGVGGVVTTPTRHQTTGELQGVSSVSSLLDDTGHPTPQKTTPGVSSPAACADCGHTTPGMHYAICPTLPDPM